MAKAKTAPIPTPVPHDPHPHTEPDVEGSLVEVTPVDPNHWHVYVSPLYLAVDPTQNKVVGASAIGFEHALKEAGQPWLWAQNKGPGASNGDVLLLYAPPREVAAIYAPAGLPNPDGSVILPDGTKQFPNAPTGPATGQVGASTTPPVPSDWMEGDRVYRVGLPESTAKPIHAGSLNYGAGTFITEVFDDTEGWKTITVLWTQFRNLDAEVRAGQRPTTAASEGV